MNNFFQLQLLQQQAAVQLAEEKFKLLQMQVAQHQQQQAAVSCFRVAFLAFFEEKF